MDAKRIRSPNYPAFGLPEAIEKVTMVYKAQHTHAAPREVVVKGMGYNSLNGASATAISALHKYGLLDRVGDGVRVSERALRILHPHSPEERRAAIREAALDPPLFAELLERFPPPMPSEELLRNYLVRNSFAPAAVSSVILAYRETMDLVDREAGGYDSQSQPSEVHAVMMPHQPVPPTPKPPHFIPDFQGDERSIGRYDFEGGGHIRIVIGGEVATEQALDMAETLINLKRQEIKARNARALVARESEDEKTN